MSKALGEFLARVGTYKPLYKSFISNAKNGNLECRDKNILYQVLKPQDTKEAFEAIAIEFTRSDTQEPMNKHLKSRIDHWKNLFTKYEPVFIKDKLSFVAKDIDKNQKIVGALLSCDLSAEPNTKFAPVTNDDIIFSLFDALIEVQDTIDSNKQIVPILKCYHQFLTTVNSGYKEQDILDFLHNHYFSVFQLIIIQADN